MDRTGIASGGAGRGSLKSYGIGFILSVVLTIVAFGLVMAGRGLSRHMVFFGIFGAALLQILVHLHYFLHLDRSSTARWNVLALLFTLLILFIFIGGTLWIMASLNSRMM